ncbi:hypothetical protein B0H16DRAFT_1547761 [Mycena metata]|uniref:Uncharacterized protein n=1 Tax=Mycena metata TaxID=1033252 RepID=A0AAD7IX76_9AGAR|nr:hypothetical protein B0H16DRAFT_1547761 [Mycena metata]
MLVPIAVVLRRYARCIHTAHYPHWNFFRRTVPLHMSAASVCVFVFVRIPVRGSVDVLQPEKKRNGGRTKHRPRARARFLAHSFHQYHLHPPLPHLRRAELLPPSKRPPPPVPLARGRGRAWRARAHPGADSRVHRSCPRALLPHLSAARGGSRKADARMAYALSSSDPEC